jgi:hypothetical protein
MVSDDFLKFSQLMFLQRRLKLLKRSIVHTSINLCFFKILMTAWKGLAWAVKSKMLGPRYVISFVFDFFIFYFIIVFFRIASQFDMFPIIFLCIPWDLNYGVYEKSTKWFQSHNSLGLRNALETSFISRLIS